MLSEPQTADSEAGDERVVAVWLQKTGRRHGSLVHHGPTQGTAKPDRKTQREWKKGKEKLCRPEGKHAIGPFCLWAREHRPQSSDFMWADHNVPGNEIALWQGWAGPVLCILTSCLGTVQGLHSGEGQCEIPNVVFMLQKSIYTPLACHPWDSSCNGLKTCVSRVLRCTHRHHRSHRMTFVRVSGQILS